MTKTAPIDSWNKKQKKSTVYFNIERARPGRCDTWQNRNEKTISETFRFSQLLFCFSARSSYPSILVRAHLDPDCGSSLSGEWVAPNMSLSPVPQCPHLWNGHTHCTSGLSGGLNRTMQAEHLWECLPRTRGRSGGEMAATIAIPVFLHLMQNRKT